MKSSSLDTSKLFHVLVVGGMAMAMPACSSPDTTNDKDAEAADSASDQSSTKDSSVVDTGVDVTDDGPCLNKPGDCSHGLCSW